MIQTVNLSQPSEGLAVTIPRSPTSANPTTCTCSSRRRTRHSHRRPALVATPASLATVTTPASCATTRLTSPSPALSQMPRQIRHPAHKDFMHIVVGDAASNCRVCGRGSGSGGFLFCCDSRGYQVRCQCAAKQLRGKQRAAHAHSLRLFFSPPDDEEASSCDLCWGAAVPVLATRSIAVLHAN